VLDFLNKSLLFGIIVMITIYYLLKLNSNTIKANALKFNIKFVALKGEYIGEFLFINSPIKIQSSFYKAVAKEINKIGVLLKYFRFKRSWKYLKYKTRK
jgi:hypothetical protein